MQRDLTDDTVTPAELFEFAPDQIILFPKQLQFKRAKWAEVVSKNPSSNITTQCSKKPCPVSH